MDNQYKVPASQWVGLINLQIIKKVFESIYII